MRKQRKKPNIKLVFMNEPSPEAIDRLNTAILNMILRHPNFKPTKEIDQEDHKN
jgi:hypothetical protein